MTPLGVPSWIASIAIDRDDVARLAFRRAKTLGASVVLVESGNAIRNSGARLRLYTSCRHDPRELTDIGTVLAQAIHEARDESARFTADCRLAPPRTNDASYVDI